MLQFCRKSLLIVLLIVICFSIEAKKKVKNQSIFIIQNGMERLVDDKHSEIEISKGRFSIEFYNKKYNAEKQEFYAARLAVFYDTLMVPEISEGMSINAIKCFMPGTGMAANVNNEYSILMLNPNAHHYLYYENEQNKRMVLKEEERTVCRFSLSVDTLSLWQEPVSMHNMQMPHLYLALLIDRNLNGIVDKGEYTFVSVKISENQKYSYIPYWNIQDENGQTALHHLMIGDLWGKLSVNQKIALLKEASANPKVKLYIQDKWGNTPLHYAVMAYNASDHQAETSYELIKLLLVHVGSGINTSNFYEKNTPFIEFISHVDYRTPNFLKMLSLFLAQEDLKLNTENIANYTAYDYAESSYFFMEDSVLLAQLKPLQPFNYGASLELFKMIEQVDYAVTPYDSAFFVSNMQLCFDYEANPNFYSQSTTPMVWLCSTTNRPYGYSKEEINDNLKLRAILLRFFMQQEYTNVNESDAEGNTPLHRAVQSNSILLVKTLLQNEQIDINCKDDDGNTPLLLLLRNYRYLMSGREQAVECLKVLMDHAAQIDFQVYNYQGETVKSLIEYNWPDLKLLKKRDEDLYRLVSSILEK